MKLLYDSGVQGTKVRFLQWLMIGFGGVMLWLATLQPLTPPPLEVETPGERRAAQVFAVLAGVAAVAGILVYARSYIARVEEQDAGSVLIRHPGLVGSSTRVVREQDLKSSAFNDGFYAAGGLTVDAPWHTVRLRNRRIPLILDVQGRVLDSGRLERALGLPSGSLWEEPEPNPVSVAKPDRPARSRKRRKRR